MHVQQLSDEAQSHRSQLENRISARRRLGELYKKEVLGIATKGEKQAQKLRRRKASKASSCLTMLPLSSLVSK